MSPRPRPGVLDGLNRVLHNDQLVLLVLALVIGTASAYGAIAFRQLYLAIQGGAFGTSADTLLRHAADLPFWQILLAPAAGGLAIGLFIHYVVPQRRPHGVPDVMEAVALRGGRMDVRAGLGSAVVNAASIGVGASVGREGPVVHLGAMLGAWLADRLGFSRSQAVTLLGCGVAAAISASFNAPIAGVFFALEVVIGHYALSAFAPIVIASVLGTVISRIHYGDFPAFIVPQHSIESVFEFPAFALLGVVSAFVAIVFVRSIILVQGFAVRTPVPRWSLPMFAGVLVGAIALLFPQVLGVGYGATDAALGGLIALPLLIALIVAKIAATAISLGSGFGGGVFSPSLFIGAMLGGAFGTIATGAFPELSSGPTAYALVGMGAVAGSVLGAPISTILIIFELSGDYALTIAVMVGVVIASVITQQSQVKSFFSWQLRLRGINLAGAREAGLLGSVRVRDLMTESYTAIKPSVGMPRVRDSLLAAANGELYVVEEGGGLLGTISLADLSEAAFDTRHDDLLNANDVARRNPSFLEAGDTVEGALKVALAAGSEHIPVVEDARSMKLVGVVNQVDLIQAHNRALLQARREERGEA